MKLASTVHLPPTRCLTPPPLLNPPSPSLLCTLYTVHSAGNRVDREAHHPSRSFTRKTRGGLLAFLQEDLRRPVSLLLIVIHEISA